MLFRLATVPLLPGVPGRLGLGSADAIFSAVGLSPVMHGSTPILWPAPQIGRLGQIGRHGDAGPRIVQRDAEIRQIAVDVLRVNVVFGLRRGRQVEARSLEVGEEEELVFLNRSAEAFRRTRSSAAAAWAVR